MEQQAGSLGVKNTQVQTGHPFSSYMPNPLLPNNPYVAPLDTTVTWAPDEFVTVGDIVRVLTLGNSIDRNGTTGEKLSQQAERGEQAVRLDLRNPYFRNIFQHLTAFDPNNDGIDNDGDARPDESAYMYEMVTMPPPDNTLHRWRRINGDGTPELKVRGKININAAPWFVIAQLPWVSQRQGLPFDASLARAIAAYRDKTPLLDGAGTVVADYSNRTSATGSSIPLREAPGFSSIGELNFVVNRTAGAESYRIDRFAATNDGDLKAYPDLTQTTALNLGDGIPDDFEERDVIFSRISNLATVRSDIFTAYIVVRLGEDGPEKRVVAILDRSDVYRDRYRYKNPNDPDPAADWTGSRQFGDVKLIALHPVADPR